MFSPEHFAVVGLTGRATEARDENRDGVLWQYDNAARTGVTLQFRQEVLAGALIRLVSGDGAGVYPSPGELIAGLGLPAPRDEIRAHFGAPRQSTVDMDLFLVDAGYVRFDYAGGVSTDVTVILPGAAA